MVQRRAGQTLCRMALTYSIYSLKVTQLFYMQKHVTASKAYTFNITHQCVERVKCHPHTLNVIHVS